MKITRVDIDRRWPNPVHTPTSSSFLRLHIRLQEKRLPPQRYICNPLPPRPKPVGHLIPGTIIVWVLPTSRVIQRSEHSGGSLTISGTPPL